jgi:hypothetical protein
MIGDNVGKADNSIFAFLLSLLSIKIADPNTIIGSNCSPISVIGGGSNFW